MICEKCGIREANIQCIQVVNGERTEHYFCAECARELGLDMMKTPFAASFSGDDPLSKIISGLLGIPHESQPHREEEWDQVICPTCGTSYSEFVEKSRFGCAQCYSVFDLLMKENLKKIQAGDTHTGKHPKFGAHAGVQVQKEASVSLSPEEELSLLKSRLQKAVQEEEFEDAARYRDQIRACEAKIAAAKEEAALPKVSQAENSGEAALPEMNEAESSGKTAMADKTETENGRETSSETKNLPAESQEIPERKEAPGQGSDPEREDKAGNEMV